MVLDDYCACCSRYLPRGVTTGVSGLYSPNQSFMLCEQCWLEEEALTEETGTNAHPDRLQRYRQNLSQIARS